MGTTSPINNAGFWRLKSVKELPDARIKEIKKKSYTMKLSIERIVYHKFLNVLKEIYQNSSSEKFKISQI